MTEQDKPPRLPIKGSTGDTLALVSIEGVELWCKRKKCWESFSIEKILQLQIEVARMTVEKGEKVI